MTFIIIDVPDRGRPETTVTKGGVFDLGVVLNSFMAFAPEVSFYDDSWPFGEISQRMWREYHNEWGTANAEGERSGIFRSRLPSAFVVPHSL